jgi:hypothetical protein
LQSAQAPEARYRVARIQKGPGAIAEARSDVHVEITASYLPDDEFGASDFIDGPLLFPGMPFTPLESCVGCVPCSPLLAPVAPLLSCMDFISESDLVAGPFLLPGAPDTPGPELCGETGLLPAVSSAASAGAAAISAANAVATKILRMLFPSFETNFLDPRATFRLSPCSMLRVAAVVTLPDDDLKKENAVPHKLAASIKRTARARRW